LDIAQLIQTVAIYALPVIFAITVHEAAHGYAARYFGDNTAWALGRVTLNPAKHIDPVGTILMPLLLYFATSGAFVFGYAKPVPVRFGNLRNPKRDMVWVALAGPGSNLAMAMAWYAANIVLDGAGVSEPFFISMCYAGLMTNIVMFALNLFPLPPLDGGRVLVGLLPMRPAIALSKVEPWGFFVVMGLIVTGVLSTIWMQPVMLVSVVFVKTVLAPLAALFS
jgi:Zn-dependent protease